MKHKMYIIDGKPEDPVSLDYIKWVMKTKGHDKIVIQELLPDKEENDDYCTMHKMFVVNEKKSICKDCERFKKLKGNVEYCEDLIHISFKLGRKMVLYSDGSMVNISDIKN